MIGRDESPDRDRPRQRLTPTEVAVLRALAAGGPGPQSLGISYNAIGKTLGISAVTVRCHVNHIAAKLKPLPLPFDVKVSAKWRVYRWVTSPAGALVLNQPDVLRRGKELRGSASAA